VAESDIFQKPGTWNLQWKTPTTSNNPKSFA
jgi:hypothetical protein